MQTITGTVTRFMSNESITVDLTSEIKKLNTRELKDIVNHAALLEFEGRGEYILEDVFHQVSFKNERLEEFMEETFENEDYHDFEIDPESLIAWAAMNKPTAVTHLDYHTRMSYNVNELIDAGKANRKRAKGQTDTNPLTLADCINSTFKHLSAEERAELTRVLETAPNQVDCRCSNCNHPQPAEVDECSNSMTLAQFMRAALWLRQTVPLTVGPLREHPTMENTLQFQEYKAPWGSAPYEGREEDLKYTATHETSVTQVLHDCYKFFLEYGPDKLLVNEEDIIVVGINPCNRDWHHNPLLQRRSS